jgi:mono/diheme cytochrome c family protein
MPSISPPPPGRTRRTRRLQRSSSPIRRTRQTVAALALGATAFLAGPVAQAATPAELLAGYTAQAGSPAQAARGQAFFNATHGRTWSCASCHGVTPSAAGQHASTGKPIGALAPAFNPERFSDPAKVEKWFRRNCNDVAERACTPAEKADVLAWLMTLKP